MFADFNGFDIGGGVEAEVVGGVLIDGAELDFADITGMPKTAVGGLDTREDVGKSRGRGPDAGTDVV